MILIFQFNLSYSINHTYMYSVVFSLCWVFWPFSPFFVFLSFSSFFLLLICSFLPLLLLFLLPQVLEHMTKIKTFSRNNPSPVFIRITFPCHIYHLHSKIRVCRGIPIFLIFAPKHRLWVLNHLCEAVLCVPTILCFEQK